MVSGVLGLLLISTLCLNLIERRRIPMFADDEHSEASVLKAVPVGTSFNDARSTMEASAFVCQVFEDQMRDGQAYAVLSCYRDEFLGNGTWRAAIYFEEGAVWDVGVGFGRTSF